MTSSEQVNILGFKAPQYARMNMILRWLREKRRFNSGDVVEALNGEASIRTIKSDIENLRVLGYGIEYDYKKKSYVLTDDSGDLPVPQIRQSELAVLELAQQIFESIGVQSLADTADQFVNRIRELMPALTGVDISALSPSLTIIRGPHSQVSFPYFNELTRAIGNEQSVEIQYFTMYRNEWTTRTVDPYRLVSRDGRSYMIAWCHLRVEVRIFRLDRIRELTLLDKYFDVRDDYDEVEFLAPMFGIFNDGKPFEVKVRFSPWVARWIREDRWHPTQRFTDLPDGSLQVDMLVTGSIDVKRWILSFGKDAEVLAPKHLRAEIAADAAEMARNYS